MKNLKFREITANYFGVDPNEIILSDETLNPEQTWFQEKGVSYVKRWENIEVHRFNGSWEELSIVGCREYYNGNHDHQITNPIPLHKVCDGKELFFAVLHEGADNFGEEFRTLTIHKAPNFEAYWKEIDEKDVQRWNDYLKVEA